MSIRTRERDGAGIESRATAKVAAVQWSLKPLTGRDDFVAQVERALAGSSDAEIVVFPELMTTSLLTTFDDWRSRGTTDLLRELPAFTDWYRELFRDLATVSGKALLAGTHLESTESGTKNTAFLFTPDGQEWRHSKTHVMPYERWIDAEGETLEVVEINGIKTGVAICYEIEVPEIATALARQGAELLLCPSYTSTRAGFWRVRHCAQARSIENQVYVVHAGLTSELDAPIPPGFAQSSILTPCDDPFSADGVAVEAPPDRETVATAELDLTLLRENRVQGTAPLHADRIRRAGFYERVISAG